ncbi:rod shape-determining protein MreD [Streptococcus sp. DD10]|uniref:rod shape-determining protein MreD n=1 Tax=Streptococcus sp. DD10 TaxID=1777878 RepID=UPI00082D66B6
MQRVIKIFILFCISLLLFFIDGQISTFFSNLLPISLHLISHLLFLAFMWFSLWYDLWQGLFLASFIGFFYDLYYHHVLGFAIILFPIIIFCLVKWNGIVLKNIWTNLLSLLLMIFFFEITTYFMAYLTGLTTRNFSDFVLCSLLISLLFNLFNCLLFYPIIRKIFI